uniref:Putative glycoside hydrolase family 76 protein n=1 Tax=Moniliophthora roreri TaxID=221103 RepID=A0A0W0F6R7_MONRR
MCSDLSMGGGTFELKGDEVTALTADATSIFFLLSAYLGEVTSNQIYIDAAKRSLGFIRTQLLSRQGLVMRGIYADQNRSCETLFDTYPYNTGFTIEALSILTGLSDEESDQEQMERTIAEATNTGGWQNGNGVVSWRGGYGDPHLIRALSTVYVRTPRTSELSAYIKSYLGVQFNAVTELATSGGSSIYGGQWNGPPVDKFEADNQTAAVQVLLAAIPLSEESTSPITPVNPVESDSPPPKKPSAAGAIAGGVVGGLTVLMMIGIAVIFIRRRRYRRYEPPMVSTFDVGHVQPIPPRQSVGKGRKNSAPTTPIYHFKERTSQRPTPSGGEASTPAFQATPVRSSTYVAEPERPVNQMTTAELVQVLNGRLQTGQWSEEELPPEYPQSHVGSA